MEWLANVWNWLVLNIGKASWNPLSKLTEDKVNGLTGTATEDSSGWSIVKLVFAVVAPFGFVLLLLHYFGIIKLWGKKRTRRRKRISSVGRFVGRVKRRVNTSARSKQLAALAKGRRTRMRNLRAKRKK